MVPYCQEGFGSRATRAAVGVEGRSGGGVISGSESGSGAQVQVGRSAGRCRDQGQVRTSVARGRQMVKATCMSLLTELTGAIKDSAIEIIDLTAPLRESTPIIQLPAPFANTKGFKLTEISRYDDRGPAWYWNDITTGEHAGTHFDAPVHWVTGRDGEDVSQVPARKLIAPAAVLDFAAQAAKDPDFLLEVEHVKQWESANGPLPEGGWLLYRTGWDARSDDQKAFLNASETGPHTPGISVSCAEWLAEQSPVIGVGVETVGTDAGTAHSFDPPFPCHSAMLGAGKYGLTQLRNLDRLPPQGAVVVTMPLPIVGGSGSPCRAVALVER